MHLLGMVLGILCQARMHACFLLHAVPLSARDTHACAARHMLLSFSLKSSPIFLFELRGFNLELLVTREALSSLPRHRHTTLSTHATSA